MEQKSSSGWRSLIVSLIQTGPENLKRTLDVLDKMPTDKTLNRMLDTMDKMTPYLPALQGFSKVLTPENMSKLEGFAKSCPDSVTLNRLASVLPMLEKLPDKETLNRLLVKADSLQGLLDSIK